MKTLGKKTSMVSLVAVILGGLAGSVLAQGATPSEAFINPTDIKWGAAPPSMPQGTKIAVLQGDPSKPGPFVIRLMVPPGSKIPPHWHSQDESLTVIAGTLYFGSGDKIETSKAHTLTAGGFHFLAGNDHHYVVAKSQAVVQVNGNGPFDIMYSNSDDDPQKAKK
jgi:quercetin dioxygenase-like cupin family protein